MRLNEAVSVVPVFIEAEPDQATRTTLHGASEATCDEAASPLILRLCAALDAAGIAYCHWKSNWRLDRWAQGHGDLDLLVARSDADRFNSLVASLNFKATIASRAKQLPGVQSFYGYDARLERWIHLHVHYQLVLGHDLTKNYRLPIEHAFLQSAVRRGEFMVAAPELELLVFVIRMVLKYTLVDCVLGRGVHTLASVRHELAYLEKQVDSGTLYECVRRHLPCVTPSLLSRCSDSLRQPCSVSERMAVRRELRRSLKAHSRGLSSMRTAVGLVRKVTDALGRRMGTSQRNRLASGGAIIAIIGGDGAGKSTAVGQVHAWLAKRFPTRKVHLGKPPKSLLTTLLAVARNGAVWLRLARRPSLERSTAHSIGAAAGGRKLDMWTCLRAVAVARDRFLLYRKIRRFSSNGGLVVSDRFPLPAITTMDSPIMSPLAEPTDRRLIAWLREWESSYYRHMLAPDVTILLRLDPETAVARKPTEPAEYVRRRAAEVWSLDTLRLGLSNAHFIDAHRPRAEVQADIRSKIWDAL